MLIDNPHDFQGRPGGLFVDQFLDGSQDIVFAPYNDMWHAHKKLASRALKSIVESSKLAWQVNQTVEEAVDRMLKINGPVSFGEQSQCIITNVLMSFCYGQRLSFDDPVFKKRLWAREAQTEQASKVIVLEAVPGIRRMRWLVETLHPAGRVFKQAIDAQREFIRERVQHHKDRFNPNNEVNDILDALFLEQHQMQQRGESGQQMTDEHVYLLIFDIFEAGVDTTQLTLRWFILFMIEHPEIQDRCSRDIAEVMDDRPPELSDRKSLPFLEACLLETLRMRPVAPLGVATTPSRAGAVLGKYKIPEDTMIMTNLLALHFDPQYWTEPEAFNPSRFIEDGVVVKPPYWLPFGCGKRVCLGESLAKNDLFLITAGLLQKLKFSKVPKATYSTEPLVSIDFSTEPAQFEVLVERRS
jgi:cytochrome P450